MVKCMLFGEGTEMFLGKGEKKQKGDLLWVQSLVRLCCVLTQSSAIM